MDDENANKICKFKIHELTLNTVCISVAGTAVKILASKFLLVMEIMTKHRCGNFCGTPRICWVDSWHNQHSLMEYIKIWDQKNKCSHTVWGCRHVHLSWPASRDRQATFSARSCHSQAVVPHWWATVLTRLSLDSHLHSTATDQH